MNEGQFSRNELYWGKEFQKYLQGKSVAIFGLGGVGGGALEGLVRAGIGHFTLVDFDVVSISNLNRQLLALHSNIGQKKAKVAAERAKDINPEVAIEIVDDFFNEKLREKIFHKHFDFVVDAIDTLRSKVELLSFCCNKKIPVISSFGAGGRVDASKLCCMRLEEIKPACRFSKNVVAKLKKHGVEEGIQVVVSSEAAKSLEKVRNVEHITTQEGEEIEFIKFTPASTPVVPTVAGFLMANYILNDFLGEFSMR